MSRIEESLYNSVSKYGVRIDENINKPSKRSRLTEDLIDDFYDTFDPDGDHESGLMAHDGAELDAWINWLDDHGMDYEWEYSDDPDYEAYVIINESAKRSYRKRMTEARAYSTKEKVLYTAKRGDGTFAKLRKEHPDYTIISWDNAEKIMNSIDINRKDSYRFKGLILDSIERFPNEVMGKLTTILNDTPIPVVAVTYDKAALDTPILRAFRFGGVRVGESYHMPLDEKANQDNDRVLSDWEANLSEQDRFLYDGITNRLEDAIIAYMKFIRDVEGMTDSEVRAAAAEFLTSEAYNLDIF